MKYWLSNHEIRSEKCVLLKKKLIYKKSKIPSRRKKSHAIFTFSSFATNFQSYEGAYTHSQPKWLFGMMMMMKIMIAMIMKGENLGGSSDIQLCMEL